MHQLGFKYGLIFIICLMAYKPLSAQQFPDFHFENISTADGLSDNTITCLFQDNKGFLWIGTGNGLNRYDGNIVTTYFYEEGNANSLGGNFISGIIQDDAGVFWIGTRDGGITRLDLSAPLAKQFKRFSNIPGDSTTMFSNRITTLAELNSDYIVFSAEGISAGFINRKTFEITYHESKNTAVALLDTKITSPQPDGNVWLQLIKREGNTVYLSGLIGGTVYAFDNTNPIVPKNSTDGTASSIQNFDIDGDTIWVGAWVHGLFIQENPLGKAIDKSLALKKVVPIEAEVLSVLSWDKNFVLAGSKGNGLYLVNKKTFEYKVFQHDRADAFSLAGNKINCLLKDSNGILWVGTSAGLSKYNTIQWQLNATLIKDDFTKEITHFSIFEFKDHTFGLNTGMGLFRYFPESQTFTQHHFMYNGAEINPTAIVAISDEKHYLTTETNTFFIDLKTLHIAEIFPETLCNPVLETCYRTKDVLFGNYQIYDVLFDTFDNHILHFFTTIGSGVGIYDATDDTYYNLFQYSNKPNSISNNFVRNIYRDSKGNIWVSTSEGLNKWNKSFPIKNDFTIYKHSITDSNSISHNNISAVWEAPDGILWIATSNGLNAFDGKKFTRYYNTVNGLQQMFGLYPDNKGNLWLPIKGGFLVFSLQNRNFRFVPLIYSGWSLRSPAKLLKSKSGTWMYGAGNYLISFNPDQYIFETGFPELYITDLLVSDKLIDKSNFYSDLVFKHDENFVTINFSSLQLSQPNTVKYRYQLSGLTENWTDLGKNNVIRFTSLPPGKYTLYIQVTNPQGDWSSSSNMLSFEILKPYWQTWWFYLLCILSLIGITFLIIRYREQQLKNVLSMRNKIANDLHDDVGSALSTINLYSEVAKNKSGANKDLEPILDKITGISTEMQENMTHIVWSLQPRNDNFDQMLLRIKSYALENLSVKNIEIYFDIDEKLSGIKIAANKRKELFLIYKEVLNNIQKYANATQVHIQFKRLGGDLRMEIRDNGIGFDIKALNDGNGMFTMRERAAALNGNFDMDSEPGKGTTVVLTFKY